MLSLITWLGDHCDRNHASLSLPATGVTLGSGASAQVLLFYELLDYPSRGGLRLFSVARHDQIGLLRRFVGRLKTGHSACSAFLRLVWACVQNCPLVRLPRVERYGRRLGSSWNFLPTRFTLRLDANTGCERCHTADRLPFRLAQCVLDQRM
jgi:hypothetical protein